MAASVATEDTLKFTEFHSMGAAYAVYLKAVNTASGQSKEGWVSCGSFMFPYKALRLSEQTSLVMPEREPQRFVSAVTVYTQAGDVVEDTIEVNRPLKISGWNIYQLSYDETKGRWSDVSVFELVRDPWLPAVYAGIIMMVLGAVCLFVNAPKGKKKERRRRYELGLFCSVCHCRFTLLGMGSFRCMAWKTPGSGIYLYLPGTGCLFSFIVGMWISLERPPMRTMGETRLWYSFFFRWRESSLTAVGSINGFSVSVPFCHWCLSASIYSSPKYTIRL